MDDDIVQRYMDASTMEERSKIFNQMTKEEWQRIVDAAETHKKPRFSIAEDGIKVIVDKHGRGQEDIDEQEEEEQLYSGLIEMFNSGDYDKNRYAVGEFRENFSWQSLKYLTEALKGDEEEPGDELAFEALCFFTGLELEHDYSTWKKWYDKNIAPLEVDLTAKNPRVRALAQMKLQTFLNADEECEDAIDSEYLCYFRGMEHHYSDWKKWYDEKIAPLEADLLSKDLKVRAIAEKKILDFLKDKADVW